MGGISAAAGLQPLFCKVARGPFPVIRVSRQKVLYSLWKSQLSGFHFGAVILRVNGERLVWLGLGNANKIEVFSAGYQLVQVGL